VLDVFATRQQETNVARPRPVFRARSAIERAGKECAQKRTPLYELLLPRRTTRRSVKFIRWLGRTIREELAEAVALLYLRHPDAAL